MKKLLLKVFLLSIVYFNIIYAQAGVSLTALPPSFLIFATTSQLVKTKGESLTGIKSRYQGNIPSNISAIKNYSPNHKEKDFMTYGSTNTKNLYLLLFEDL